MLEIDHSVFITHERFRLHGLPKAYDGRLLSYEITYTFADGKITGKSRGHGNGSVRYYSFKSLDEAFNHARLWGNRKIAENTAAKSASAADTH